MAGVCDNWERLVRATVKREQLKSSGQGVVPSLGKSTTTTTSVNAILQAADAIQDEDPNASRILCEQAHSMAQNLDPKSDGIGVLQFKVGLVTVIKQRLAIKHGGQIDQHRDIEYLLEFYQRYSRLHRVGDIQRRELTWRESGTFGADFGKTLVEVMKALSKDADPNGVGKLITEELQRVENTDATLSGELTAYKDVLLEAPPLINAIGAFPEVRGTISAFKYINSPDFRLILRYLDNEMRTCLIFWNKDSVRNQRVNVVLTFANAQSRLGKPIKRIDEKAMNKVFLKVLDSYIEWCRHLRISTLWNSFEALGRDWKLILVSLYFLIWGEAANFRFLPKCVCYIFHHMARELDAMLDHREAYPAASCRTESGSVSFLEQIVLPIYEALIAKAARNNNRKAAHSAQRNYDDCDEYFWSLACFELSWPMRRNAQILLKPKNGIFASCIGTLARN